MDFCRQKCFVDNNGEVEDVQKHPAVETGGAIFLIWASWRIASPERVDMHPEPALFMADGKLRKEGCEAGGEVIQDAWPRRPRNVL